MNAVKTASGAEVYVNEVYRLADEYIASLEGTQEEVRQFIRKPPVFKGMLKYIYLNLFKPTRADARGYNNSQNCILDYGNIDLLNDLWDTYTSLCYKYMQAPTLPNFSLMTGISMDAFNDWAKGNTRSGSAHSQSYKKWLKECETSAYDSALSGNPGGMFILKSNYGYTEQPQRIELVEGSGTPQVSMAELEKLRESHLIAPDKPEL